MVVSQSKVKGSKAGNRQAKAEAKETEEDKAFDPDKPDDEMADDLRDRNNRTRLIKSYGQVARPTGIKKKAVFNRFDMFFCLIIGQNRMTYKVKNRCLGNRELSHRLQAAIGSNGWVQKSLCNRFFLTLI